MSKGVWVSSACEATRKRRKPTNCVRMNGNPIPPHPKISPSRCARTIPCMDIVPAWHDVVLLDELHAVADELEPAVEAPGVHRTEAALHVAHHLEQEHVAEDERGARDHHEDDDRLDRERRAPADVDTEDHRSMSP